MRKDGLEKLVLAEQVEGRKDKVKQCINYHEGMKRGLENLLTKLLIIFLYCRFHPNMILTTEERIFHVEHISRRWSIHRFVATAFC